MLQSGGELRVRRFEGNDGRLKPALAFLMVDRQNGRGVTIRDGSWLNGALDIRLDVAQKLAAVIVQRAALRKFTVELFKQGAQMFLVHRGEGLSDRNQAARAEGKIAG